MASEAERSCSSYDKMNNVKVPVDIPYSNGHVSEEEPFNPCHKCAQLKRQLNEAIDQVKRWKAQRDESVHLYKQAAFRLRQAEGHFFSHDKEKEHFEEEERKVTQLTAELQTVTKKAAILGEMYHNLKDKMDSLTANYRVGSDRSDEFELKCSDLQYELEAKTRDLINKTRDLDAYKAKAAENQAIINEKDEQIEQLHSLIAKIREDNKRKMAVEQARIVALEHSRDFYEKRILMMNEERGLPITTNGLTTGYHGHGSSNGLNTGYHGHGSSASSSATLTAPSGGTDTHGNGHHRDDSSDSYVELSNSPI